jgi:hypothetical protein
MEVDLRSRELRVAIELDGPQHLADVVAYRRDRRKDRLLQEHGYLVLRFLAEDLAKELDVVLDALLGVVSKRRRAQKGPGKPAELVARKRQEEGNALRSADRGALNHYRIGDCRR